MKLSSLLNAQLVIIGKEAATKREVIHELVEDMSEMFPTGLPVESLKKSVEEREALGGTSFPTGIAIPHARLENFDDIIIGVAIPKHPILDNGVNIRMVVLILTAANKPALYLNCLSAFARISQDAPFFERLLKSRSAHEFIDTMEENRHTVKSAVLVENVMTTVMISVKPSTTLKEINDILFKHKYSYLPVINEKDELVGEIRFWNILELGIPEYARGLGTLRFTESLETFEKLIDRETMVTAADIMKKPFEVLSPKTSLLEAAAKLLNSHERQLAVAENKRLLGIISYMDILNKIIRN